MPVMVEVDCDDDTVTRVVTLPEEIRDDRDDRGPLLRLRREVHPPPRR